MEVYRDIGRVDGGPVVSIAADPIHYSQVYRATHDGAGKRLPFMERSFISFSFGGRWIEDYGFIVVSDGTRYSRPLFSEFAHSITDLDTIDGQIYWGTHYNANSLSLTLATDGIEDSLLDEFKRWFAPHNTRELILSEHPYRAILARLSSVPEFSTYVTEREVTKKIGGMEYKTYTTLHRGTVTLEFVMDDPFWYSIENIMCYKKSDGTIDYDKWINANDEPAYVLEDRDAIKVVTEDGVPVNTMFKMNNMTFGNGTIAADSSASRKTMVGVDGDSQYADVGATPSDTNRGIIGPLIVAGTNFPANQSNAQYFYYAGTAPSAPILKFILTPELSSDGYIITPYNAIKPTNNLDHNSIFIHSTDEKEFKFTTPGIWTGYNQVIDILSTAEEGVSWVQLREYIRDNVKHFAPRAYGIKVIDSVKGQSVNATTAALSSAKSSMRNFLFDLNGQILTISCEIDCRTGRAKGISTYRTNTDTLVTIEENIGDMVRSDYLKIEDRNFPSEEGYIEQWTAATPTNSHRIYHNVPNGLGEFEIKYKYMYL